MSSDETHPTEPCGMQHGQPKCEAHTGESREEKRAEATSSSSTKKR